MNRAENWPFDQAPNVAAMTTRQVIESGCPIRQVIHYADDHSWAFLCGTTEDTDDYRVVHMQDMLNLDPSLRSIADLPPGWSAWRENMDKVWQREPEKEEPE